MWQVLSANAAPINVILNAVMVVIWLVYLQIFLVAFLRGRRSSIHIDMGAARDENARCIVTNMGQQPVYLLAIVVDFGFENQTSRAVVTDRDEVRPEDAARPLDRTNQGPMAQGEARDTGSLEDLMQRGRRRLDMTINRHEISAMWVTALGVTNEGSYLIAGTKRFTVEHRQDGTTYFSPDEVLTRQVRSPWRRRRLLDLLEEKAQI